MRKPSILLSTFLSLTAFVTAGWCTTLPGRDRAASLDDSSSNVLISKAAKLRSVANTASKETGNETNMTDAPDPATPFLIGAGLVALSLLRRRFRRDLPDE